MELTVFHGAFPPTKVAILLCPLLLHPFSPGHCYGHIRQESTASKCILSPTFCFELFFKINFYLEHSHLTILWWFQVTAGWLSHTAKSFKAGNLAALLAGDPGKSEDAYIKLWLDILQDTACVLKSPLFGDAKILIWTPDHHIPMVGPQVSGLSLRSSPVKWRQYHLPSISIDVLDIASADGQELAAAVGTLMMIT